MTLDLTSVGVRRGRTTILDTVGCTLQPGQIVGLIGPNGTGKSTLINAIATLLPFSGTIRWHGRPVELGKIGYMPQHALVQADLTVTETVLLGRHERLGWQVKATDLDAAIHALEEFGIAGLHDRSMNILSGGQQQLVLLAQRLLRQPDLLLLDEATSALDIRHQMQVFDRLRAYVQRTGALVVIAIHDLNLAARHTDRILLLHQGRVAGDGPFETVISPDALRRVYGIEAEILVSPSGHRAILPLGAHG
ncbi:ABC transporter ATP-binding protein [Novispirillum itersonii]|uniref:Iron complex transport system ATP-binding protein n=1 Tax=Novispirillum itersonii TaxID=189 RepID=A0A7W9ZHC1_NOVIT|nr:ABC transporter ATP-binding protein [Novispirillum itersonii]MBB6210299.1 iron complex transport system ATP-binding protein [Novispirillum itersonii]